MGDNLEESVMQHALGYGDAPCHTEHGGQCAGTTMSSDFVKVIQFWKKDRIDDWVRIPDLELGEPKKPKEPKEDG